MCEVPACRPSSASTTRSRPSPAPPAGNTAIKALTIVIHVCLAHRFSTFDASIRVIPLRARDAFRLRQLCGHASRDRYEREGFTAARMVVMPPAAPPVRCDPFPAPPYAAPGTRRIQRQLKRSSSTVAIGAARPAIAIGPQNTLRGGIIASTVAVAVSTTGRVRCRQRDDRIPHHGLAISV
jgi:hypothetical protein